MAIAPDRVYLIATINTTSGSWGFHDTVYQSEAKAHAVLDSMPEDIIGYVSAVDIEYTKSGE